MAFNYSQYLLPLVLLAGFNSLARQSFEFEDKVYDENIKTVQLYPKGLQPQAQTLNPIISLRSTQTLILEFDELYNDAYNYMAKIIHCTSDWKDSELSALQYLNDYNEFNINTFDYSASTITPYVHYKFELPKPKVSGNYLLVVYAEGDEEDIIITRRFMIFEKWVSITPPEEIMSRSVYSLGKQNLQFDINYGNVELINPMDYVKVNILQNHRWDNPKLNIKPSFIYEMQKRLEYNHFAGKTSFDAGNEFREFDMRSLKYFGFHVAGVKFGTREIVAQVEPDKPRVNLAYTIEQNMNGQFYIENVERKIPAIENDYAMVNFTLATEEISDKVYLTGKFTDWKKNSQTLLKYNDATQSYEGTFLLKQGHYNYQYLTDGKATTNGIEGDYVETKNTYEIFVYYQSPKLMADLLIGYEKFIYIGF